MVYHWICDTQPILCQSYNRVSHIDLGSIAAETYMCHWLAPEQHPSKHLCATNFQKSSYCRACLKPSNDEVRTNSVMLLRSFDGLYCTGHWSHGQLHQSVRPGSSVMSHTDLWSPSELQSITSHYPLADNILHCFDDKDNTVITWSGRAGHQTHQLMITC